MLRGGGERGGREVGRLTVEPWLRSCLRCYRREHFTKGSGANTESFMHQLRQGPPPGASSQEHHTETERVATLLLLRAFRDAALARAQRSPECAKPPLRLHQSSSACLCLGTCGQREQEATLRVCDCDLACPPRAPTAIALALILH